MYLVTYFMLYISTLHTYLRVLRIMCRIEENIFEIHVCISWYEPVDYGDKYFEVKSSQLDQIVYVPQIYLRNLIPSQFTANWI